MAIARPSLRTGAHALHAILLSFPIALFSGALLSDIAYLRTAEIQWTNFSAWLIAFALVFGGLVAAWALVSLVIGYRDARRDGRITYFAVLAAMWVLGLINAFKHSQDAWSSVGALGLILSVLCTLLALAAGVLLHAGLTTREIAR
ncbi:hypothetical protein BZG35_08730 [Brevundimonas sp. LM2]|uniref:DUF2231 domain-containing protein n=1 Tax=Brevundimonas sp. LM2 TaxID=1938605 RepID=UPI000983E88B|nr:DUF2231 domain-containing protein [Brevundimonas sp. LM2]AQR61726.1 hypothetical protein BZG35_08730 [Brevundimonas sp. LM2]